MSSALQNVQKNPIIQAATATAVTNTKTLANTLKTQIQDAATGVIHETTQAIANGKMTANTIAALMPYMLQCDKDNANFQNNYSDPLAAQALFNCIVKGMTAKK